MAIYWTRELEIGVEPIDRQHQELFARIDALLSACQAGRCQDEVSGLLGFLQAYVQGHFSDEEELMGRSGYPELAEHAAEHAGFGRHLQELVEGFAAQGFTSALLNELNATLIDWLYDHICRRDRALGQWLALQTPGRVKPQVENP